MKLLPEQIHEALSEALSNSLEWNATNRPVSNSLRSAKFLSELCGRLDRLICLDRESKGRYIGVNGDKRNEGEWLLDGVWAEETRLSDVSKNRKPANIPIQIWCALECESSTNGYDFFRDFSKLLVVSSPLKIFAAGLNQGTESGVENYLRKRIGLIEKLLNASSYEESATDWYVAFWPSPLNVDGESLWRQLNDDYSHLNNIRLFYQLSNMKGRFKEHLRPQVARC